MGWHLIETLVPADEPTVMWSNDARRDWTSIVKFQRAHGIKIIDLITRVWASPVQSFEVREHGPAVIDEVVGEGQRSRRVVAHHVVGPDDTVYGVQLWIESPEVDVEPRPRTAGMKWDLSTATVYNSKDSFMLRADNLDNFGRIRDADQFFNRVYRFDGVADVVAICNDPTPGARMHSAVTLLHDDLHLVNLQILAKSVGGTVVRGIGHDITRWDRPYVDPVTAMRISGATPTGHSAALMAFSADEKNAPAIAYWITDPPSWLNYWSSSGPTLRSEGGLIHKNDRGALRAARRELEELPEDTPTTSAACIIRLEASDGTWKKVRATLSRYPANQKTRMLYIAQLTEVEV